MNLDLYAPCPCGSGKKVKFCCSDVAKDLDDILAALEGNQRVGALDRINRALDKHPNSPALLAMKASTLLELGEHANAEKVVDQFLAQAPQNPVALALSAVLNAIRGEVRDAVLQTQQSLEIADKEVPIPLYEAIATLAQVLIRMGHFLSGRQHLLLQAGLEGNQESPGMQQLLAVRKMDSVPLMLRSDFTIEPPPAESTLAAADVAEWNAALDNARTARWFKAVEQFLMLATRNRQEPGLWHNIAVLYGWLADEPGAAKAWRQKSKCEKATPWQAIEAEALAQLLEEPGEVDLIPQVEVEFAVPDAAALKEHLLSTKQAVSNQFDPDEYRASETDVPPQAVFTILDRDPPAEGTEVGLDNLPRLLGSLLLYGKQTDRDARCEFVVYKDDRYETALADVRKLLGNHLGEQKAELVLGQTNRSALLWQFMFQVPAWAKAEQVQGWIAQFRRRGMLERWQTIPRSALGGKSADEAASDPALKTAVSGALLIDEVSLREAGDELDLAPLRERLQLPAVPTFQAANDKLTNLSYWQYAWLEVESLSEAALSLAFSQAISVRARSAVKRLGPVLIAKLKDDKSREQLWAGMSQSAPKSSDALAWLGNAKQLAVAAGRSPAVYLLMEFPLLLREGMAEEGMKVMQELQTRHINEPGVAQALTRIMVELGLVSPQQLAAARAQQAAGQMPSPVASPLAATVTPGGGVVLSGQPAGEPAKSKLWLPGD